MIRRLVRVGVALVLLAGMLGALLVSAVGSSRSGAVMALGSTFSSGPAGSCGGPASPLPAPSGPGAAGLSAPQTRVAQVWIGGAMAAGLSARAAVIGVAAGLVESGLLNLASRAVPESMNYPNDGVASGDHDSVGIAQQRAGGWGTVAERMDPATAASMFYTGGHGGAPGLTSVSGWESMPVGQAAQTVQVSAFPDRYAVVAGRAAAIVAALSGGVVPLPPPVPCPSVPPPGPGGSPGTGGVSTVNIPCAAGGPGRIDVGPGNVQIRLCTVGGIEVDTTLSRNLAALLAAAQAAGLSYGGGAYRSHAQQIELRKAHCGGDIYTVPASSCSPPTAIPGHSMHEWGLAIDFTEGGSLISSHGDRGWVWLNAHAATYGLRNLASEPWHWSVNGN